MNKPVSPVVIIGCGYIGKQVARYYQNNQATIHAVVQSSQSASTLKKLGFSVQQADLASAFLPAFNTQNGKLFHFAPPPSEGTHDTHTQHLLDGLKQSGTLPKRVVYISTTGVYGDCKGRWIDENEPVKPDVDRARRRLDAEQQLSQFGQENNVEIIILRVAGIYGPGKLPVERLKKQLPVIRREEAPFTNRIHATDLLQVAIAAMEKSDNGEIYNVADGNPSTMTDYFSKVAIKVGLPRPPVISLQEGQHQLSAGMMSYMRESRRLKNTKMLEKLGIELNYPDLDSGLNHCGL